MPYTLNVSKVLKAIPINAAGPFPAVKWAGIGSLFHRIANHFVTKLAGDDERLKTIEAALASRTRIDEQAIQPMKDYIFDELLKDKKFKAFHQLDSEPLQALWTAIETFLYDFAEILVAALKQDKNFKSVLLGAETDINWLIGIEGKKILVTGKADLLLFDHRYDQPHLVDFKLCGVKKDLANMIQVMLYAHMLNHDKGLRPGATVLNLYPARSPIPLSWEQINMFKAPLVEFIRLVASREFPGIFRPPEIAPDPLAPLEAGSLFATPELLEEGAVKLSIIKQKLEEFAITVDDYKNDMDSVVVGPAFTVLRVVPGKGVKVASISNRSKDLQVALELDSEPRIIQGPGYVSIEVPRSAPSAIPLLDLRAGAANANAGSFILGVDIMGAVHWADFSKSASCHLLVGGQTGSGKSEFLRQLICSLAVSGSPQDVKITIVDPKMTDYQDFAGSPYLERPVLDKMDEAVEYLDSLVGLMEERYHLFQQAKVKTLVEYNSLRQGKTIPRIILVFDEFADAMADADLKKSLQQSLKRLGAKARAAGIHLVIATQSPRKEVVTGLIKANLPCVVALRVESMVESKIILDAGGAETLLGRGDLLAKVGGKTMRLQSPYADSAAIKELMLR